MYLLQFRFTKGLKNTLLYLSRAGHRTHKILIIKSFNIIKLTKIKSRKLVYYKTF